MRFLQNLGLTPHEPTSALGVLWLGWAWEPIRQSALDNSSRTNCFLSGGSAVLRLWHPTNRSGPLFRLSNHKGSSRPRKTHQSTVSFVLLLAARLQFCTHVSHGIFPEQFSWIFPEKNKQLDVLATALLLSKVLFDHRTTVCCVQVVPAASSVLTHL